LANGTARLPRAQGRSSRPRGIVAANDPTLHPNPRPFQRLLNAWIGGTLADRRLSYE